MKIIPLKTPENPCRVCGGILRFPKKKRCVACVREENRLKCMVTMGEKQKIAEQPPKPKSGEQVAMEGVDYT